MSSGWHRFDLAYLLTQAAASVRVAAVRGAQCCKVAWEGVGICPTSKNPGNLRRSELNSPRAPAVRPTSRLASASAAETGENARRAEAYPSTYVCADEVAEAHRVKLGARDKLEVVVDNRRRVLLELFGQGVEVGTPLRGV